MHVVAHSGAPAIPGLRLFGTGQSAVVRALDDLERQTRRSVWSLQPQVIYDPDSSSHDLEARSRARGIDVQMIAPSRTARLHPLLPSLMPELRLGPAPINCIIVDERAAVVAGPRTAEGATTAWFATSGEVFDLVLGLWAACREESQPALSPGESPPLNHRQLEVARALCLGSTDAAIARQLGISPRTVARDVATILEVTRASSRTEAVLNMLGRGRSSRD